MRPYFQYACGPRFSLGLAKAPISGEEPGSLVIKEGETEPVA